MNDKKFDVEASGHALVVGPNGRDAGAVAVH